MEQRIHFCSGSDGVRIAYAASGKGPPLVRAPHWLTHVEFDWRSPVWRSWLGHLSSRNTLIRFDPRGCGLSDREVENISFEAWVSDLERVVDAAGLERFALFGASQGGAIAAAYAARHPERVSRLILYGAFVRGRLARAGSRRDLEEAETFVHLARVGWGTESPAFRQVFTSLFLPEGTLEQWRWFNELQRLSASGDTAARILEMCHDIDVRELAPQVRVPTLVLHAREDARVPFEEGRLFASLIPQAQFVPLESRNHVLLESEPAWADFTRETHAFLRPEPPRPGNELLCGELTVRERQVLDLIAQGLGNEIIHHRLHIRPHTLRNHITNIFDKLRVSTRAEAIVKARDAGFGKPSMITRDSGPGAPPLAAR
jgi:pimeloyl-ACP methyl ester carboxylesterase/DNA-binding CsgD family transcriptional regulator